MQQRKNLLPPIINVSNKTMRADKSNIMYLKDKNIRVNNTDKRSSKNPIKGAINERPLS